MYVGQAQGHEQEQEESLCSARTTASWGGNRKTLLKGISGRSGQDAKAHHGQMGGSIKFYLFKSNESFT